MPHFIVRRATRKRPLAGPAILGFTVGAAAGFLLGELWAPAAEAALRRPGARPQRSMADLVRDAQAALADDPELGALVLDVLPVSRQRVELHGWVNSRAQRARAHRLAGMAVGADAIINSILVRGEDDAEPPTLDVVSV